MNINFRPLFIHKTPFYLILFFLAAACLTSHPAMAASKKKDPYKYYLSATAIFRDEADYLNEWIHYHEMLGVEHLYLYNNLSSDNYMEVLKPHIDRGFVELADWPYEHSSHGKWISIQLKCYKDAIEKAEGETRWLIVFDTDEFIVPNQSDTIAEMLKKLEKKDRKNDTAAYKIGWIVFGTSDVDKVSEEELLIERLTKHEARLHPFSKSIVRPEYVKGVRDAHHVALKKHKKSQHLSVNAAQINHYTYRDKYFFETVKIPRILKIGLDLETFLEGEFDANVDDSHSDSILRFVPALKKKMGLNAL